MDWTTFCDRVLRVESHVELKEFVDNEMPPMDTQPRHWFTSLQFFLSALRRPGGASDDEWALYRLLARRMVDKGLWPAEAYKKAFGE